MGTRLYRSQQNRILGGVASGLADYFDVDPVLIRVLFVISALGWGVSIIAYIILWIVVPAKLDFNTQPNTEPLNPSVETNLSDNYILTHERKRNNKRVIGASILIFIGSVWLLDNFIPGVRFGHIAPVIFIAIGLLILMRAPFFNKGRGESK